MQNTIFNFQMKRIKHLDDVVIQRETKQLPVLLNFKQYKVAEIPWVNHCMSILQAMLMILIAKKKKTLQKMNNCIFSEFSSIKENQLNRNIMNYR